MLRLSLQDTTIPTASKAEADAVVAVLQTQNERIFKISVISAIVVGTSALITAWRTLRQMRRDEALFSTYAKQHSKK